MKGSKRTRAGKPGSAKVPKSPALAEMRGWVSSMSIADSGESRARVNMLGGKFALFDLSIEQTRALTAVMGRGVLVTISIPPAVTS